MASWFGPYLQPPDRGYAVTSPPTNPDYGANASLQDSSGSFVWLKVTEISTNFGITGAYAQSMRKRDFMPHAVVQPAMTIKGQCSNQFQHGRIGEFVRHCQEQVLDPANLDPKHTLIIWPSRWSPKTSQAYTTTKGGYSQYTLQGWVKEMGRGGTKFNFAPEFQLTFQIGAILDGLGIGDASIGNGSSENGLLAKAQWEAIFKLNKKQFTPPGNGQPDIPPPPPAPPPAPPNAPGQPFGVGSQLPPLLNIGD